MTTNERFHQSIQDLLAGERNLLLTGFADLDDYIAYHDAVRRDPQFNDLMLLMTELADGVRDQYRAANPCMGEFEWWHLSFGSPDEYQRYRESLGTSYDPHQGMIDDINYCARQAR